MEVGTALAVVAFADQCIKYGNAFVKRCRDYLHADEEATELLLAIEYNWTKMETQIDFMRKISGNMDQRLQDMQSRSLSQLEGKLKTATYIIDKLRKKRQADVKALEQVDRNFATTMKSLGSMSAPKKVRFVLEKSSLLQVVDEIEKWQARYDPSWFLIMQKAAKDVDESLSMEQRKPKSEQIPIIVAAKGIRDAMRATEYEDVKDRTPIWLEDLALAPSILSYSDVQLSALAHGKEEVLIDTMITHPEANANMTIKAVRNLARILAEVDPSTFGLLKCRGVEKIYGEQDVHSLTPPTPNFKFIFSIPPGLGKPRSLREILLSSARYPLDERLELAKKLVNSVLFVHTAQFVHKNIRPETVIVFQNDGSPIGAPFLFGFQQFRVDDGSTYRQGDGLWQQNLYRHPSRQGIHPEVDYGMQHDIYSLGVVLLEIGLWTSFVLYSKSDASCLPQRNSIIGSLELPEPPHTRKIAYKNKQALEELAERELSPQLGKRYTSIVLQCLRCLDTGPSGSPYQPHSPIGGNAWADEDGVTVGVRYIENVIERMQAISI